MRTSQRAGTTPCSSNNRSEQPSRCFPLTWRERTRHAPTRLRTAVPPGASRPVASLPSSDSAARWVRTAGALAQRRGSSGEVTSPPSGLSLPGIMPVALGEGRFPTDRRSCRSAGSVVRQAVGNRDPAARRLFGRSAGHTDREGNGDGDQPSKRVDTPRRTGKARAGPRSPRRDVGR